MGITDPIQVGQIGDDEGTFKAVHQTKVKINNTVCFWTVTSVLSSEQLLSLNEHHCTYLSHTAWHSASHFAFDESMPHGHAENIIDKYNRRHYLQEGGAVPHPP